MKDQPNWFPKVHRMPSEWVMPDHFPDLSYYEEIAIDLETRDPNIKNKGPGYIRKDGEVVGIAVAVEGWQGYYPIAHDTPPNMDKNIVRIKYCPLFMQPSPCTAIYLVVLVIQGMVWVELLFTPQILKS